MQELSRREALTTMAVASATTFIPSLTIQAETNKKSPNIIFILADDLGYGDVGCFGQEKIQTPRLDQMAREGIRFTQAYAGSTVCAPSRYSLMTGMHQGHAYIRGNTSIVDSVRVPLRKEDVTIAELLQDAGYTTCLIGKWGLGENGTTGAPNAKGFDEFFGYTDQYLAHNYFPDKLWRNDVEIAISGNIMQSPNVCSRCETYVQHLFTEEALKFIRRPHQNPFFLYLAYTLPHANNEAGRVREHGMEIPSDAPYSDRPWPAAQRSHAAMISLLDHDVGILLDTLRQQGIAENTLVLFSSDNGPHAEGGANPSFFNSTGGLRGIKRDLYEGGIRVPTLAWWPETIAPTTVSNHVWAFWDFFPTAAELANIDCPPCDGLSFVPTLKGQTEHQKEHDYLYWEFHERAFKQAVRIGRMKAIRNGKNAPIELYDLERDPGETNDLAQAFPHLVDHAAALFISSRTHSTYWPAE